MSGTEVLVGSLSLGAVRMGGICAEQWDTKGENVDVIDFLAFGKGRVGKYFKNHEHSHYLTEYVLSLYTCEFST